MTGTIRFNPPHKPKRPRHWSAFGERERLYVLRRDRHECQLRLRGCTQYADQVDHIVSKEDGGSDHRDNLRASCAHCNRRKWSASIGGPFFVGRKPQDQAPAVLSPHRRWSASVSDYGRRSDDASD